MSWNTDLVELANEAPPSFHDYQLSLASWWREPLFFSGERETVKGVTIDLSKVMGHDQGYPPMTWKYMLRSLKRIDRRLQEVKKNPNYYLENFKSDLTFTEIDGCFFILEGKHRTTVAKYLTHFNPQKFQTGPLLHGVDVLRHEVNYALMNKVQHLRIRLRNKNHDHLEFSWLKPSWPYHPARFKLTNKLRPNKLPLFFNEDRMTDLIEVLDNSEQFIKAFRSDDASYLRNPLVKIFSR